MNPEEEELLEAKNALEARLAAMQSTSFPSQHVLNVKGLLTKVQGSHCYKMQGNEPLHTARYEIIRPDFTIDLNLQHPLVASTECFGVGDQTGRVIWPASVAFACWLCDPTVVKKYFFAEGQRGERLSLKSVVEICAGCSALPGLSLGSVMKHEKKRGALGGSVLVTEVPGVLPILRDNLVRNSSCHGGCVEVAELDVQSEGTRAKSYDVLLGCECVFDGVECTKVARKINNLLGKQDGNGTALIAGIGEGRLAGGWVDFDAAMAVENFNLSTVEVLDVDFIVRIYKRANHHNNKNAHSIQEENQRGSRA